MGAAAAAPMNRFQHSPADVFLVEEVLEEVPEVDEEEEEVGPEDGGGLTAVAAVVDPDTIVRPSTEDVPHHAAHVDVS